MLKGILKVIDDDQMERLHEGILDVLEKTGLQIHGRFLLEALADAGCAVDFKRDRVRFKPDLIESQIARQKNRYKSVRSSIYFPFCSDMPADDVAWPDEFCIDFGYGTPSIYDFPAGKVRRAKVEDQIDMIRFGNALDPVKAVCAPFICSEFDPAIETIESARILMLNTKKPGWVGTSAGREVKYLAELAMLASGNNTDILRTKPPIIVNAYCTTSPLKIDTRACEVLKEALKYKFPVNFASMPILGATTPVTPAGSIIVAAAEILGGITAATLIAPDIFYYSTSISGEMDMKTTQVCYSTPAAILTDAAIHQLFRYKYGMVHCVEPSYIEAKHPDLQASFMKIFRQMGFGCTAGLSLPIGLLDNASVFSPTQAIIDLDVNKAIYKFSRGIAVNDDTMCLDLINDIKFCESGTYLESEHTLRYFRDVLWDTAVFDRTYGKSDSDSSIVRRTDESILQKADKKWRELVAREKPVEIESRLKAEIDMIVEAARKDILGAA